ncbi:Formin Homology 2 Domain [Phytophthora infestans]|uniref:Formin Homology 2 Domain n=1 Tax=Phytophthora infestans TaxID=4787 RepID=A0A8S9V2W6_PHYIN|nr:Formin Homology 2 Domain [Phytophthora infestans]
MKKSEDQPRFDDLSPRVDASGSEAEEESTRKGKMQERELGSDAPDWKEKSSDARNKHGDSTGSRAKTIEEAQQPRATVDPRTESQFHTLSTDETDEDESNYQIVKKSIYKPQRKGFLSRLAGSPMASPKQKYALSDITGIITGEEAETVEFPSKSNEEEEVGDVDLTAEDEEGIEVAIDRSGKALHGARGGREHRLLSAEDAAMGGPSEVVIHSGESDSGFVTLNPIISSSKQRKLPNQGAFVAPGMTKSSGIPVAKTSPVLMEIPAAEQANAGRDRLLLIINALGATGLLKAEKFGTQSCFLEMRLFDSSSIQDCNPSGSWSSYLMRTDLHKKGGSEAQWNQQFTTTLRSNETQLLHVEVKTSSKILVGEANVALDKVGDLFYDQHYPLFRSDESSDNGDEPVLLSAGQVHLQLKIVDTVIIPTAVVPPLQLPGFSRPQSTQLTIKSPLSAKSIPAALLNGGLFFKIPYHTHNMVGRSTGPRRQWVAVRRATDPPHLQITWGDPTSAERKNFRSVDLALVTEIREGHSTAAFAAQTESNVVKEKEKCFSLVMRARTLDLVAASKEEAQIWVNNLRDLLFPAESSMDASVLSARTIESFKQSALSSRGEEYKSSGKPTATAPTKRMIAAWRNRIFNLARNDRLDDILESLEDGCPIDLLEGGTGDTLLMLACRLGNAELVELCLSRRAKNDPHPEFGETALQVAVNSLHAHCVGLLLSTAAKSDMDTEIVNHIDPNNDAPLHVAARHGDLACLQLLLHHGADICVVEEFGRTPLHCAVANGNLDCVAYLLDVGGDSVLNSGDHDGDTALHYAALSGNEDIVKLLLESAANVFATNVHKETAYDIAVREKQQRCAELISRYFLTNEKEANSSITRNEPASTLLERSTQDHPAIIFRNNGKVVEDEFDKEIPSAFAHTEVWKPTLPSKRIDYEDERYETHSERHRSSSYTMSGSATSRLPLSPTEQIREALTRKQRAHSLSPRGYTPAWSGTSYQSARELPGYGAYSGYNERLVATERLDRDHFRPYHQYATRENDSNYPPRQSWDQYHQDSGYPLQYDIQTPRQAAPEYAQPLQAHWSEARPATAGSPATWSQYHQLNATSYPQQVQHVQLESQWDTVYTEDGYPYYVNKTTGVSQWEKPVEDNIHREVQSDTIRQETLSPDAIIRLRLAQVRVQKSQTALVSPVSSPASTCSTPTLMRPTEAVHAQTLAPELYTAKPGVVASLEPSKYETRTGLKLSVDIAAPQAQDVTRPVLVPSPRSNSKSPVKKFLENADEDVTSGSFEKSRASSPRGRSKNIQLIEIKRANNLALALASFKIHDHYDKIVNDIVTMDERVVKPALLGCLQRFFPTAKEKQALQSFNGSISSLGKAERFFCLLFQVPGMQERIDMFLYKLEFARTRSTLLSRVLVVKRACRDLVDNYSFMEALEQFFKKQSATSFSVFDDNKSLFKAGYLSEVDEKLRSFRGDLEKAMGVELVEVQLQLNRLVAGMRPIQSFVNRSPSSRSTQSEERDSKARDILQRFLADTRTQLAEVENEYEAMELWGDKLLAAFGESKATCQISAILQAVVDLL